MDIVLALVAGFLFALGLVLQELAASAQPRESVGGGFILRLLHQPVWLLGLASQGFGFVAQAWALGIGRMVIVQPLLVSTIVFALPIARILTGRRIARIEIVGASIVTGGLAVLLTVSKTEQGTADASLRRWLVVGGACVGIAAVLFALARTRDAAHRAGLLGSASGILFGLAAALTKATVDRLDDGVIALLWDWHLYALIAVSAVAFWLEQVALQTGALSAAVGSSMALDPLSSIPLGILLFDETLHESAWGIVASALALAATIVGLVLLTRAKSGAAPGARVAVAPAPT
jgi:drug/metabolite transporter (DMT)-like permease